MTDLISRADSIEAIRKAYFDKDIQSAKDDPCIVDAMTDWAIRQIKELPSAEAVSREVYEKRTQSDEQIIDSYRREFAEAASAEAKVTVIRSRTFVPTKDFKEWAERMREKQTTVMGGVGFVGLLTIAFIVLKLLGIITWSWVWVLAPIWIDAILVIILLAVVLLVDRR